MKQVIVIIFAILSIANISYAQSSNSLLSNSITYTSDYYSITLRPPIEWKKTIEKEMINDQFILCRFENDFGVITIGIKDIYSVLKEEDKTKYKMTRSTVDAMMLNEMKKNSLIAVENNQAIEIEKRKLSGFDANYTINDLVCQ